MAFLERLFFYMNDNAYIHRYINNISWYFTKKKKKLLVIYIDSIILW